jgi:hypothetical protein
MLGVSVESVSNFKRTVHVVILQPVRLRWIQGAADDPKDSCAHGDVEFRIDDDVLLDTNGKDLTVSAAALYLLRTLSVPHTKATPVGDHLFPCCGFAMWDIPGQDDVAVCGCPNCEDFEILHQTSGEGIVIRAADGREWKADWPEWRASVFAFADRVSEFYTACSPKHPSEDDVAGFKKFQLEWERRRGAALG